MSFFKDLKHGIAEVFSSADEANLYRLNGRVPLKKAILFGVQHVLAMFMANITPLMIVFSAIGILKTPLAASALQSALFMAGIGTTLQILIGGRLPIVVGTSFTFVSVFISIGTSYGGGESGYYVILGSIIAGGLISAVLCIFVKWWAKIIKPIVPSVVVLGIGLSLIYSGVSQFLGGSEVISNPKAPIYYYVIIAFISLISAILWQIFAKGAWKNLNIIFGMAVGFLASLAFPGVADLSLNITNVRDVINYPRFADFSRIRFEPLPILLTALFYTMSVVEGIGNVTALCRGNLSREPDFRELGGTLICDGINSSLSGVFGAMPLTTFAQNIGIVSQTKVINRFTVLIGGLSLILISFFPIISDVMLCIPECVIGGVMVMLFGGIITIGIKMCAENGFTAKNMLIISLSVCLGFGLSLQTEFFALLKGYGLNYLADILSNNVINMFIIAFVLSYLIPDDFEVNFKKKNK